jgi:hypothetical protein
LPAGPGLWLATTTKGAEGLVEAVDLGAELGLDWRAIDLVAEGGEDEVLDVILAALGVDPGG